MTGEPLGSLLSESQRALAFARHGRTFEAMLRARDRWDSRWVEELADPWTGLRPDTAQITQLATSGQRAWAGAANEAHGPGVEKAVRPLRVLSAVGSAVQAVLGAAQARFQAGGLAVYMRLARGESEDAGQHSLDMLGLNRTFRWTSPRDIPRDLFQVRGSKIIQGAYGDHIDRLRDIVVAATDPASPRTQSDIRSDIKREWPALSRKQIERIARTEVAAVWTAAQVAAYEANDVAWYTWSIAQGPSIGPPKSERVCPQCLRLAAASPYPIQELPDLPAHPNCRCVIIPSLEHDWLPPAEPWAGNEPPVPLRPAPLP